MVHFTCSNLSQFSNKCLTNDVFLNPQINMVAICQRSAVTKADDIKTRNYHIIYHNIERCYGTGDWPKRVGEAKPFKTRLDSTTVGLCCVFFKYLVGIYLTRARKTCCSTHQLWFWLVDCSRRRAACCVVIRTRCASSESERLHSAISGKRSK